MIKIIAFPSGSLCGLQSHCGLNAKSPGALTLEPPARYGYELLLHTCCRLASCTWGYRTVTSSLPSFPDLSWLHLFPICPSLLCWLAFPTSLLPLAPRAVCRNHFFFSLCWSYLPWMCPQGCIVGTSGTQLLGKGLPHWRSPQGPSAPIFNLYHPPCFYLGHCYCLSQGVCKSLETGLVCEDSHVSFSPKPLIWPSLWTRRLDPCPDKFHPSHLLCKHPQTHFHCWGGYWQPWK